MKQKKETQAKPKDNYKINMQMSGQHKEKHLIELGQMHCENTGHRTLEDTCSQPFEGKRNGT